MDLVEEIAQRHGLPLVRRGGCTYVPHSTAEKFLDACEREKVRVVGFDGLHLQGKFIVPDMNAIANFSSPKPTFTASDSIRRSREVIRLVGTSDMVFDFHIRIDGEHSRFEVLARAAGAIIHEDIHRLMRDSPDGSRLQVFLDALEETIAEGEPEATWITLMNMGKRVHAPASYWHAVARLAESLGDEAGKADALAQIGQP